MAAFGNRCGAPVVAQVRIALPIPGSVPLRTAPRLSAAPTGFKLSGGLTSRL